MSVPASGGSIGCLSSAVMPICKLSMENIVETLMGAPVNEDVEHDDVHFARTYTNAIMAINAQRIGKTWIVQAIYNAAECPRCLTEALVSISVRLGGTSETHSAGQDALTTMLDTTGWLASPSYPGAGDLGDVSVGSRALGVETPLGQASDSSPSGAEVHETGRGSAPHGIDTGASHHHGNFDWIYSMALSLVESIRKPNSCNLEYAVDGSTGLCRTCLAEAVASIALGIAGGQDAVPAALDALQLRHEPGYEPVLRSAGSKRAPGFDGKE
jgi:hypothetical protein